MKTPQTQTGAILVLVLLIIAMLSAIMVETLNRLSADATFATSRLNRFQARENAETGLVLALRSLAEDGYENTYDTLQEDWNTFPAPEELKQFNIDTNDIQGTITDESGLLPINYILKNTAIAEIFVRLLTNAPYGLEEQEAEAIRDAIQDWLDDDDSPRSEINPAEDNFYLTRELPYHCKNGTFSSKDELLLVRGITTDLFFDHDGRPGLYRYITLHSKGEININTAPLALLAALPSDRSNLAAQEFAHDVDTFRRAKTNEDLLGDSNWFRTELKRYADIVVPDVITTSSAIFRIHVLGMFGMAKSGLDIIVERTIRDRMTQTDKHEATFTTLERRVDSRLETPLDAF